MTLTSTSMALRVGLAGLVLAVGCSDDGVQTEQNDGATGTGAAADSGVATTLTTAAGSMSDAGDDDGVDDGADANDDDTGVDDGPPADDSTSAGSTTNATSGTAGESTQGDPSTSSDGGSSSGSTSTGEPSESSSGDTNPGKGAVGDECAEDNDCASEVCWDFADYDPLCGGAVCSVTCEEDIDCVEAMEQAGAPYPEGTFCGFDGRCDMVGTGFGAFFCA